MDKFTQIESKRLVYRGITRDDADAIVKWRSNPANYRNFFSGRAITLEEHLAWFERYLDDETRYDFMIFDAEGQRIGTVGISELCDESCEVNYMIGELSARGKGYAREAVEAISRFAVVELGVKHVDARILAGNDASIRVAQSAGYELYELVYRFEG
ncbi:MAG: GNAT family N-acetyltransferase [Eggerthellaceae bacterium]|nr:GNAT family N-acetyltransferase [Eggerthellaceae bacterium]